MAGVDPASFHAILARLETVADRLEQSTAAGGGVAAAAAAAGASAVPDDLPIVQALDAFIEAKVSPIEGAAKALGVSEVTEATATFIEGFRLIRSLLVATARCRKPADQDWAKILGPIMELGQRAGKACDNRSEYFANTKAIAEALFVFTFPTSPAPPSHVQNALEAMDFHAMKVLKKKVPAETAWINALKDSLIGLKEMTTENCKLGILWVAGGEDPVAFFAAHPLGSSVDSAAAPKAAAAPGKGKGKGPALPKGGFAPKPREEEGAAPAGGDGGGAGMAAVFSDISGFSTGKLKKVTDDMKSKNQPKAPAVIPKAAASAAVALAGAAGARKGKGPRGPPAKELQRGNWVVENFEGVHDLSVDEVEQKQLVCIINCKNVTVTVPDKAKSISIDGCDRANVILKGDVISTCELVNSDNIKVQTLAKVNAFAIDKCNGVNLWLSKESLEAEVITSKSSEMNLTVPEEGGDEYDTVEIPIPEQFVTRLVGPKKLQTEVSSLYTS